jgi:SAM-dependent methyltransferase
VIETASSEDYSYPWQSDDAELQRLSRQGRVFGPASRIILSTAGITPGMKVLDLGCGVGELSFLAAEVVGPEGRIIGIDTAGDAVALATKRAERQEVRNVDFFEADVREPGPGGPFDAVIGRLVLMYLPDPAAVLRTQATLLRPGGLVIQMEVDVHTARAVPSTPLFDHVIGCIAETFRRSGVRTDHGSSLWSVLQEAGLSPQGMIGVQPCLAPDDPDGAALLADSARTVLPLTERSGVTTAGELDLATLQERLARELELAQAVYVYPTLFGAWARVDTTV